MKEIKNYNDYEANEVVSSGLEKGIYVCKIVGVKDVPEKEYLEVKLDVARGPQAGFFTKLATDTWPNQGIWRASYKETATKFFKAFMTAVEKSNTNYRWDWNEQSLVGKQCVAVFAEEEYLNKENEVKVSVKIREIRSLDALSKNEIKMPELKKLKNVPTVTAQVAEISDEDVPF